MKSQERGSLNLIRESTGLSMVSEFPKGPMKTALKVKDLSSDDFNLLVNIFHISNTLNILSNKFDKKIWS